MDWFWKSVIAMVLFITVPFLTSVMKVKSQVEPEVTLVWWMISIGIGVGLWSFFKGQALFSTTPILLVGGLGITVGVLANIFLFQAFTICPNPGIPMAIVSANAIIAVALTKWLAVYFPKYFAYLNFSWVHLAGAVLIVSGIVLIRLWG
jgi:hypothetical protein